MIVESIGQRFEPAADRTGRSPSQARDYWNNTLCSAVVQALDDSGLPYCILGAPARLTDATMSDIDFVVRPADFHFLPALLASAAVAAGGRLVQALQHETTATYFAIAGREGDNLNFVHPDCTTDYRRRGRLWLLAEELLSDRIRASAGFWRPAPDVDFEYYLMKQVLKHTLTHIQWQKLNALYRESSHPERALSHWPWETRPEIERALQQPNPVVFRNLMPRLSAELHREPQREQLPARTAWLGAEITRIAQRITHPTGLFVRIAHGDGDDRGWLAERLCHTVAPAFRRAWVAGHLPPAAVLRALIASTLVISVQQSGPLYGGVQVRLEPRLKRSENLERATDLVISHLSRRTACRLRLDERAGHLVPVTEASVF